MSTPDRQQPNQAGADLVGVHVQRVAWHKVGLHPKQLLPQVILFLRLQQGRAGDHQRQWSNSLAAAPVKSWHPSPASVLARRPDACGHWLAAEAAELPDRAAAEVVRLQAAGRPALHLQRCQTCCVASKGIQLQEC